MTEKFPQIEDAPGHIWKRRKAGWECRWQARTDLVQRGYLPKSAFLWKGTELDAFSTEFIQSRCRILQDEMLAWGRGGEQAVSAFDGSWRSLIACYETDPDSSFRKLRYATKKNYLPLMKRLFQDVGPDEVASMKARDMLRLHENWTRPNEPGGKPKTTVGHSLVGMVRILVNFGATILESEECEKVANMLHRMKFKMGKPRGEQITADQAEAVRAELHRRGLHSIALAQAGQFDFTWRQKDMIGEWVPLTEDGISDVIQGNNKWLRGLRWEEIDQNLILKHTTSKKQKEVILDLRLAPMVVEELRLMFGIPDHAALTRDLLPASGPVVVNERNGMPWQGHEFRRKWRAAARASGIPDKVFNMDSRAGAITEGVEATGGDLDSVRISATHSNVSQTQNYSRGDQKRIAAVMTKRAAHRNKSGTSDPGTDGELA